MIKTKYSVLKGGVTLYKTILKDKIRTEADRSLIEIDINELVNHMSEILLQLEDVSDIEEMKELTYDLWLFSITFYRTYSKHYNLKQMFDFHMSGVGEKELILLEKITHNLNVFLFENDMMGFMTSMVDLEVFINYHKDKHIYI